MILDYAEINMTHLPQVGGKNASLGEMITELTPLGIKVPRGFAVVADAYRQFLQENNLDHKIYSLLADVNPEKIAALKKTSAKIRKLIINGKFSKQITQQINTAYRQLNLGSQQSVAVRSSATAEDLPASSFAGQQETYLNISGINNILTAVKLVYASLFTERAISYRIHHGFNHSEVAISAGIQQMIRSDLATSGVAFTIDTESGFDQVVFITAAYGLGETIVQGIVNPDEFYVHKPTFKAGKAAIISRKLGSKQVKMIYHSAPNTVKKVNKANKITATTKIIKVAATARQQFCLTDEEILILAKQALIIEEHYGKPMDIEWAKDGKDQQIYITQARPETVKSRLTANANAKAEHYIEKYHLVEKSTPILSGRSIGEKIGQGVARKIANIKQMEQLKDQEVLVADMTDPDWEPIMKRSAAIVTNRGGRTCHAAIVARELGIPAVVGCGNATELIASGKQVTVSCADGETGYVYPGLIKYQVNKTDIKSLPKLPVKLCMNLANPDQAFAQQALPNDGIGLARLELIIGNAIGIHPNAILNFANLTAKLRKAILQRTSAYATPLEFYLEKLTEGIATISAAFYPKPVIVRFSDFKSNEYSNLLGGAEFEPHEENPMLGYRGAARYVAGFFKECFALECAAIKRVRDIKGLTNTHVMFPFVRTVAEAEQLVVLAKKHGLSRGQHATVETTHDHTLKFYMMCEIPSNALLAEQFLQHFDGYSIGSNDLTQLTLGVDRDSELVANLFDERNAAVKNLLQQIISTCKKLNKYVGICGQGPSDHLDFAQWLMEQGIDAISLTPDTIVNTWLALGRKSLR